MLKINDFAVMCDVEALRDVCVEDNRVGALELKREGRGWGRMVLEAIEWQISELAGVKSISKPVLTPRI